MELDREKIHGWQHDLALLLRDGQESDSRSVRISIRTNESTDQKIDNLSDEQYDNETANLLSR